MKKILCTTVSVLLSASIFAASGDDFTVDLQADNLQAIGADLQAVFESGKEAARATAAVALEQNAKDDAEAAFKNAEKALDILIKNSSEYASALKDIKTAHKNLYKSCGQLVKEKGYGNDPLVIEELVKLLSALKEEGLAKIAAKIVDHQYWNGVYENSQNISRVYNISDPAEGDFVKNYLKEEGALLSAKPKEGVDEEWNSYISLFLKDNKK